MSAGGTYCQNGSLCSGNRLCATCGFHAVARPTGRPGSARPQATATNAPYAPIHDGLPVGVTPVEGPPRGSVLPLQAPDSAAGFEVLDRDVVHCRPHLRARGVRRSLLSRLWPTRAS